jgi:DnaJ domain
MIIHKAVLYILSRHHQKKLVIFIMSHSKDGSSPSPLPTHLSPSTKIKCPNSKCGKDLYYYPPTKVIDVRSKIVLSCASCSHIFPSQIEPPTEAISKLSITQTHYEILGVENTATSDEISRAYRKKSLQCHPDRTRGREKEWDQLTKAYEVLGDKRKRHWYDVELEKGIINVDATEDPSAQGTHPSFKILADDKSKLIRKSFSRIFLEENDFMT